MVNHLFAVPPVAPQFQQQTVIKQIKQIEIIDEAERTIEQQQRLVKLTQRLEKVRASLAYVDEVEQERQNLQARERELALLIKELKQQKG
ncbi:MAG: muramidase (phage lysozyme) [Phenylobacterium sp.]